MSETSSIFGGSMILPGLNRPSGSSSRLIDAESVVEIGAELPSDPFAAAQPVAVFAAVGAAKFPHQTGSLLGDRAHFLRASGRSVSAHIEDRTNVQRTDGGVRIPGAVSAMSLENLRELLGVIGQMLERDRAVLDEADRFAVAFEAHHDIEPGFAHVPYISLRPGIGDSHHAVRESKIAHEFSQAREPAVQTGRGLRRRTPPAESRPDGRSAPAPTAAGSCRSPNRDRS